MKVSSKRPDGDCPLGQSVQGEGGEEVPRGSCIPGLRGLPWAFVPPCFLAARCECCMAPLVPGAEVTRAAQSEWPVCGIDRRGNVSSVPTLIYQSHRVGHCRGMWRKQDPGEDLETCRSICRSAPCARRPASALPLCLGPPLCVETRCSHFCSKRRLQVQLVSLLPVSGMTQGSGLVKQATAPVALAAPEALVLTWHISPP